MLPFFPSFIPNLIQIAPFVFAFAVLCAGPLRRHPGPFYAVWTVAVVAVAWFDPVISIMGDNAPAVAFMCRAWVDGLSATVPALDVVIVLLTSSYTGVALYLIVMFIGALKKTPLVKRLLSVRSELSVIGGIVIMGHVVRVIDFSLLFASPVGMMVWGEPAGQLMFVAGVVIAIPLTLCFLVPWITSFKVVRRRMSHATWKKTQLLAYPFMVLLVAQGFFLALGHCLYGYPFDGVSMMMTLSTTPATWLSSFAQQVATAWMYLALGMAYVVLRLRKHSADKVRVDEVRATVEKA